MAIKIEIDQQNLKGDFKFLQSNIELLSFETNAQNNTIEISELFNDLTLSDEEYKKLIFSLNHWISNTFFLFPLPKGPFSANTTRQYTFDKQNKNRTSKCSINSFTFEIIFDKQARTFTLIKYSSDILLIDEFRYFIKIHNEMAFENDLFPL